MNRNQLKNLWRLYSAPVMLVIFGLILVFSPDSAIALVTKLLAWIFIAFGVISIITTLSDREAGNPVKWLWPVAALLVGGYFLRNPLVLANVLGRVIGAIIFFEGLDDLKKSRSKILPTITMAVGVILFLLPRTLTSTILGICGIVMIVISVCNLVSKFRDRKALNSGEKPKIIDADE